MCVRGNTFLRIGRHISPPPIPEVLGTNPSYLFGQFRTNYKNYKHAEEYLLYLYPNSSHGRQAKRNVVGNNVRAYFCIFAFTSFFLLYVHAILSSTTTTTTVLLLLLTTTILASPALCLAGFYLRLDSSVEFGSE